MPNKEIPSKIEHKRDDTTQPLVLPGIHRYQFFTNLKDRGWTMNLAILTLMVLPWG